jgi:lipopolysaccharide/colanic/teichoic acid biosynthesis glycosyltransferase
MRPISRTVRPLIGPRPERPQFVDLFGERIERYDDRHRVKSGVTAWAQVSAPSR